MKDSFWIGAAMYILGSIITFSIFALAISNSKVFSRKEAIAIGVAEYYLDENNEKQFRWKECE